MADHTYKRNFLNPVIFRLDFPIPIQTIVDGNRPDDFHKAVLSVFPVHEEGKTIMQQAQFSPGTIQTQQTEGRLFSFFDPDRNTHLGLSATFMFVQQTSYKGFEEFKRIVHLAVDSVFSISPDLSINRLGLRYTNDITIADDKDSVDWSSYINEQLLAPFPIFKGSGELSRYLVTVEARGDNHRSRIVAGMPNPDYPGAIRQKKFLLDIDIYMKEAISREDVKPRLEAYHDLVLRYFEQSIVQGFRDYLDRE